ncbi:enoyl-CoA hydratase/isomerase family protein [Nocardia takedensis]|uniref:enoyl-CoA hydratase/isomerase family protein n=1 Tax=Nocardia takedensis TaxID=259390 RepID=UPI0002EDB7FD|nr:enoyl-CoA hydratase/isomerase family protein [Nocardia takedensis]
MTQPAPILLTRSGPIRTLTLNRPRRRNALDPELIEALDTALSEAEDDVQTRCLILAGAGKSFCAGGDLRYFLDTADRPGGPTPFLRRVSAVVTRLETSRLPVVAALHGHAVAGGLELALACDVVVAADTTLIGDGHIRNNLLPAAGSSVRLPRKLGDSTARWLALTGKLVPAEQLAAAGWLHTVVPAEQVASTAHRVASELAAASGPGQAAFKALLHELTTTDEEQGLAHELRTFEQHWNTNDVPASLTSFLQHRSA